MEDAKEFRADINAMRVELAEIKAILTERHTALRADVEELKSCARDVRAKQESRPCETNHARLQMLERIVYGTVATTAALIVKAVWDMIRH